MPRLPQLIAAVLLAALAAWFTWGLRWPVGGTANAEASAEADVAVTAGAAAAGTAAEPEALLDQAILALNACPSLSAKIRMQGLLFEQPVTGTGRYLHARGADRWPLSRLEMKLQVGQRVVSWQQVGDGTDLWTYSKLENSRLRRVNVARVRAAVQNDPQVPPRTLRRVAGGIPQMLDSLRSSFDLDQASPGTYRGVPVWLLHGRWRSGRLALLLPRQAEAIEEGGPVDYSEMPEQAPDHVLLYLGKTDLLPYRIDYRRGAGDDVRSVLTVELFHVRAGVPIDRSQFSYHPDGRKFTDDTRRLLDAARAKQ